MTGGCSLVGGISVTANTGVDGIAAIYAGRLYHSRLIVVSGGIGDLVLVAMSAVCAGISGVAACGTSGSGHLGRIAVTHSIGVVTDVAAAAFLTGEGGVALICTGGRSGHGLVAMTGSRSVVILINITAIGATVSGVPASDAGGLNHSSFVVVTGGRDNLGFSMATTATGKRPQSGFGAGGAFCFGAGIAVTGSFSCISLVSIATSTTTVGGIAAVGTGRSRDSGVVAMSGSRQDLYFLIAANGACSDFLALLNTGCTGDGPFSVVMATALINHQVAHRHIIYWELSGTNIIEGHILATEPI